jgi:hypothetical protein
MIEDARQTEFFLCPGLRTRLLQLRYAFMPLNLDLDQAARKDGIEAFNMENFEAAIDSWKFGI